MEKHIVNAEVEKLLVLAGYRTKVVNWVKRILDNELHAIEHAPGAFAINQLRCSVPREHKHNEKTRFTNYHRINLKLDLEMRYLILVQQHDTQFLVIIENPNNMPGAEVKKLFASEGYAALDRLVSEGHIKTYHDIHTMDISPHPVEEVDDGPVLGFVGVLEPGKLPTSVKIIRPGYRYVFKPLSRAKGK